MSQINNPLTLNPTAGPLILPAQAAVQPIGDIRAFLNALPHVELEEAQALGRAVAENRAQRRADASE